MPNSPKTKKLRVNRRRSRAIREFARRFTDDKGGIVRARTHSTEWLINRINDDATQCFARNRPQILGGIERIVWQMEELGFGKDDEISGSDTVDLVVVCYPKLKELVAQYRTL